MQLLLDFLYSLHWNPVVFAIQIVLFIVFHYMMKGVIYEPLISARNEREGRIQGGLAKAEEAAARAQDMKNRYEAEIKAQREALAQQLKEATERAEKEAAGRMALARAEAGQIVDEANRALDAEEARLKAGMAEQSARLAEAIAQQVVRNSLTPDAQSRVLARLKG